MTPSQTGQSGRRGWRSGVPQAIPIVMGYVPIGLAYGVLAQKAGVSPLNTLLMSIIVYAGSSQLIAVGLIGTGAPPLSIILTTFVVNLRHLLMSAAVSPSLKEWSKPMLAIFAYELTDETFAVHSVRFSADGPHFAEAIATNVTSQLAWVMGTGLGILLGNRIADVEPLGLDYALPAMFIALLVLQIADRVQIAVALVAGALSVGLLLAGAEQWSVMIATMIGAAIGVVLEKWTKQPSS
jgi:4-azaleucine resistance transporter AzlC